MMWIIKDVPEYFIWKPREKSKAPIRFQNILAIVINYTETDWCYIINLIYKKMEINY